MLPPSRRGPADMTACCLARALSRLHTSHEWQGLRRQRSGRLLPAMGIQRHPWVTRQMGLWRVAIEETSGKVG